MESDDRLKAAHEEETEYWIGVDFGREAEESICAVRVREGEITSVEYIRPPNGPHPTVIHTDEVALWLESGRARRLYLALRTKLGQWLRSPRGAYRKPRWWMDHFR